jgi:D-alanyl-D-alanine carboxypeptidase
VKIKPSEALRFLGALLAAAVLLIMLVIRVTSDKPIPPPSAATVRPIPPPAPLPAPSAASGVPGAIIPPSCQARGWGRAAQTNAAQLRTLAWAPFRRPEIGWEVYAPLIAREIGSACPPESEAFAAAFGAWQGNQRLLPDGVVKEADFIRMKGVIQSRRPFVQTSARGICPPGPDEASLEWNRPGEGYSGKPIQLQPQAFAAYRRMTAAAKAEVPQIGADRRNLTIFSGYRSPESDAARCARDGNCNGIVRAACSPHRTGLALDLFVGQAPGFGPDSSADPNRVFMSKTPAYQWMVRNADRFGFVSYPFEPWHWEWRGG